jgi:hypothetical protein
MLAFDRAVRVGHHLYPDVPIAHLIDALVDRARPLGAGEARVNRPVIEYARCFERLSHGKSCVNFRPCFSASKR